MTAREVLWRLTRPDGRVAHCVLTPGTCTSYVVWYLDGVVQGVRDFADVGSARMWAHGELWWALWRQSWQFLVPRLAGVIALYLPAFHNTSRLGEAWKTSPASS